MQLSVIVPFLNEREVLPACLERLRRVLDGLNESYEIVSVDDGSRDGSAEFLAARIRTEPGLKLLRLSRNFGKEAAMTAGIEHAVGAAVVILDADLQDPPELIPDMVRAWREGADVVCMRRRSRAGESWLKRASAYAYYRLLNRLSKAGIPADTGDFRLMSRKAVQALLQLPERCRYMKGMYAWIGLPTRIIDYDRDPRAAGTTKWNYLGLMRLAMEGITSFSTAPLRWATGLGVAAALAGVGFGIVITLKTLLLGEEVHGYPSLIAIITFLSGVQLITIGLLGEYVGKTYMESKQRPVYLLRDVQRSRTAALRLPGSEPDTAADPASGYARDDAAGPARQAAPSAAMTGEGPHAVNFCCCWAWRPSARRGCSPWRSCRWQTLGTALRRDRAPDGRHRRLGHALVRAGRAVLGQAAAGFLGAGAVHQTAGPVRVQPAPACLRRHAGHAGAGPCLRRAPVRRQRRALGRAGVRHHAAAAGQRRRGAHRSLPGAGRDAVDDVLPAGAARRPPWWRYGFSWAWRSACCPGPLALVLVAAAVLPLVAAARRTRAVARAALDRRHDPDAGAGPALVRDGRDSHARLPPVLHRGRAFPALRRPGLARRSVRHRAQAALWRHLAGLAAGDHALGTGGPVAVPAARPGRTAADPAGVAGPRSLRAYLLLWGLAAPAFFTLSGNILWTYVLPSLPPLALALGAWMADHAPTRGWRARLPAALMLLTPLAALTLGALSLAQPERYKTEKQLVAQAFARMQPGEQLVFVGSRPFSARFYSQGAAGQLPMEAVAAAPALPGAGARLFLAVERTACRPCATPWPAGGCCRSTPAGATCCCKSKAAPRWRAPAPLRTGRPPSQRPALWAVRASGALKRAQRPRATHIRLRISNMICAPACAVLAVAS